MEEIKFSTGRRWLKLKGHSKRAKMVFFTNEHFERLIDDSKRLNISQNLLINQIVNDYYVRQDEIKELM